MFKLAESKFDLLFEDVFNRFQSGGLVAGDVVKFRKGALKSPFLKNAEPGFKKMVEDLAESTLNLKVGAVHQIRAASQYGLVGSSGSGDGADGGSKGSAGSAFGFSVDVVQEYAPGLWKNPITVPIELLERVDGTGTNTNPQPIPDEWRRKERINIKPEKAPKIIQRIETPKSD